MESLELRGQTIDREAVDLPIQTPGEYEAAGEILKTIKALRAEITATFRPIIQKAHQTHKEALQQLGQHEAPLDHAEKVLKAKMLVYVEKERERAEAEKRRQEDAERARIEDERLATAQEFAEAGLTDEADRFLTAPVVVPPVTVQAEAKLDGVHTMERKTAEVVDFMALIQAVAMGQVPIDCLAFVPAVLNAWARDGREVPGVKIAVARSIVVAGESRKAAKEGSE
jgi:hypothetical protein